MLAVSEGDMTIRRQRWTVKFYDTYMCKTHYIRLSRRHGRWSSKNCYFSPFSPRFFFFSLVFVSVTRNVYNRPNGFFRIAARIPHIHAYRARTPYIGKNNFFYNTTSVRQCFFIIFFIFFVRQVHQQQQPLYVPCARDP